MRIVKHKYNLTWQSGDINIIIILFKPRIREWPNPAIGLLFHSIKASMRQTALFGQLIETSTVMQNDWI